MQEEIENRTVNLAISTTKLTARGIIRLAAKGLAYIKRKSREAALKNEKPDGRQTIQQLIGQNQGVTNIDISQTDLKGFEKYARKYGVDYAITKDKSVFPPKYLVFFKARDADAKTAAFNAYSAEVLAKARSLTDNICAIKAVERLEEIYEILKIYGYEKYVSFDFGMLSKFQYYTGIIFQAYTYGTGEPIVKGGRYNNLLKHFGKPAASIGFGITVDNLLMALSRQKISLPEKKAPVILTYTEANRREAILEAQKLRNEGTAVALRREKEDC